MQRSALWKKTPSLFWFAALEEWAAKPKWGNCDFQIKVSFWQMLSTQGFSVQL